MSFCGELKQSTTVTISIGPFLDSTDGNTEETGMNVEDTDIFLSKNGGAKANPNDTNNCTEDANGIYRKQLDDTDTGTMGILTVYCHKAGCLYVKQVYNVLRADEYDGKYSTDYKQVDVIQIGSGTQSATDLKDFADTGYVPGTHKVQGVVLTDTCTTNTDMRGTDSAALASVVGALNNVAAEGDPTDADTLMQYVKQLINILIGTAGIAAFPAEAAPANAVSIAEVLRAVHADVTGLNGAAMRGTDNAALAATALSTAIWTAARAGYLDELAAANLPSDIDGITDAIGALNDISTADVNAQVCDVLKTDTIAEMAQGVPPKNPTFEQAAMYLYMLLRNGFDIDTVAGFKEMQNDAGVVIWKKAISDAAGIFSEAKGVSGP